MFPAACPTDDELLAFGAGELAEASLLAVGAHLESCPDCERKADRFDDEPDPVVDLLRREQSSPGSSPSSSTATNAAIADTPAIRPSTAIAAQESWPSPGGYELLEVIGTGGMGVVYRARQTKLKRLVALKRVRSFAGSARFRVEAEAVARLQHPNIVEIFEIGEQAGQPFLVLEYIDGGSLEQLIERRGQPIRAAASLVQTLAEAMHYAHSKGIVHRDLKPANVLISQREGARSELDASDHDDSPDDAAGRYIPKITDFGIAKRLEAESSRTHEGEAVGTPSYMAPEQAEGRNADVGTPADIYALGAILYELLTGQPPFRKETALATLEAVRSEEPVRPHRLRPDVPRDLEAICLKCLEKSIERRYSSAAALAEDLGRFLSGEVVSARAVSRGERMVRWCKRKPFQAALVATVVAAVAAVTSVASVAYSKVLRKNEEVERKNTELTAANASERAQRLRAERNFKRAEGNFGKARKAVHDLLTQVGKTLSFAPHAHYMRSHLMERALKFHKEFLNEDSDDPWVRFDAARAYAAAGELYDELGRRDEAERALQTALRLLQETPPSPDTERERLMQMANCHLELAFLYTNAQRNDDARQHLEQSHARWQQLLKATPDDVQALVGLVTALGTRAQLLSRLGRSDEALRACVAARETLKRWPASSNRDQTLVAVNVQLESARILTRLGRNQEALETLRLARDTTEPLAKSGSSEPYPRRLLGTVLLELGIVGLVAGRLDEAQPALARSRELLEKLHAQFPLPQFTQDLSRCYDRSAVLLSLRRDYAAAAELARKAVALSEGLHRQHPSLPGYRYDAAVQHVGLATIQWRRRRPKEAESGFRRAIELMEPLVEAAPERSNHQLQLGVALASLAVVLRPTGKPEDVQPLLRRAADHLWKAHQLRPIRSFRMRLRRYFLTWAESLAESGRHEDALKACDRLLSLSQLDARDYSDIARFAGRWSGRFAQSTLPADRKTALQEQYGDTAMKSLKLAVANGLPNAHLIAVDEMLTPLRNRADFQALLKSLPAAPMRKGQ